MLMANKYVNSLNIFPREDVSPEEKKTKAYGYALAKAIINASTTGRTSITNSQKRQFALNRMYGKGLQPIEKYMTAFYGKDWQLVVQQRKALLNLNWEIMSVLPKYKDVLLGMFTDVEYNINCSAIDELTGAEIEQKKLEALVDIKLKPLIDKFMQDVNMEQPQQKQGKVPSDVEELEMYEKLGMFKTTDEASIEKYVQATFDNATFKEVKRKVINDIIDTGCAIWRDVLNKDTGIVEMEYVDIADDYTVYKFDRRKGTHEMRYAGHISYEPISYLRGATNLSEDKLYQLSYLNFGKFGNVSYNASTNYRYMNTDGSYPYDDVVIPVFNFSFKTTDDNYTNKIKNKLGIEKVVKGKFGEKHNTDYKKTTVTTVQNVYTGKWIIGQDDEEGIYDYGLLEYIPRVDKKYVTLDYHLFVTETVPITQRCIPFADQMHMAWLRVQNDIAMSAPKGEAIDVTAISNVNIGGVTFSTLDILEMRRKVGTLLYKGTSTRGIPNAPATAKPIQELTGGIGKSLDENLQLISINNNLIQEVTGITAIAAASEVKGEQGLGVSQLALASTNNALKPIYSEYVRTKELTAISIGARGKYVAKYYPELFKRSVGRIIGTASAEILVISSDITLKEFGFKLVSKPTEQTVNALRQSAMQALSVGRNGSPLLTYDQYMFIERCLQSNVNLKDIETYLAYRLKKAEEEQQARADQAQQLNQQMQQQMEQIKQQAQMQLQQIELAKIDKKGEWDCKVEYYKGIIQVAVQQGLQGTTDEDMKAKLIELGVVLPQTPSAQSLAPQQGVSTQPQQSNTQPAELSTQPQQEQEQQLQKQQTPMQ